MCFTIAKKMNLPKWTKLKWIRWISAIIVILVIHSLAHTAANQIRGRSIAKAAGLPPLPSGVWITHANIYSHNMVFEEVTMGFKAPRQQMEEWMSKVQSMDKSSTASEASVLDSSLREWDTTSGVDFSASLSYK
jgi:hypothetical protein